MDSSIDGKMDRKDVDENLDDKIRQGLELEGILVENGSGFISNEKWERAMYLIKNGAEGDNNCVLCLSGDSRYEIRKAITGCSYCSGHAMYLLVKQK